MTIKCKGAVDHENKGICDGANVLGVSAKAPDGTHFHTIWCEDCRQIALRDGYEILETQPLEQRPTAKPDSIIHALADALASLIITKLGQEQICLADTEDFLSDTQARVMLRNIILESKVLG